MKLPPFRWARSRSLLTVLRLLARSGGGSSKKRSQGKERPIPIDVHAHYVPRSIFDRLEGRASDLRLTLVGRPPSCAIHFDYGLKVRPFFPQLVEEVQQRLDGMEMQGVDRQVLSMWTDIFGYGLPGNAAASWHRLLNEELSALCVRRPDHFSMLASVPLPDSAAAAREVEFAVSHLGAVGAVVAANVQDVNLGEIDLDEFWAAVVELDVPVFIHPVQAAPSARTRKFALNQIAAYTFDTTLCMGSLIFAGVLDRFPALRLITSHGGGAFPYLVGRFDCMHDRMDRAGQGNVARDAPSAYLRRFHYDTILHDPRTVRWLAEAVGVDRIVLGSDYSFPPSDRDPLGTLRRAGFSDEELSHILEGNPRRVFPALPRG